MKKKIPKQAKVKAIHTISVIGDAFIDSRLGRRFEADSRNNNFPIRALLQRQAYEEPKSMTWDCAVVLDQLAEGSCVGHGFAHELIAEPYPIQNISHESAVKIYKKAQDLDDYPGNSYSGTSVLAGVKAAQALYPGAIESYRWASTLVDVIATLGYHGPVVIGVNWYSGMYNTDTNGFIKVSGQQVGGHCLLARGVDVENSRILLRNSWGESFGDKGDCWITFNDFDRLIAEQGECCVIVNRGWWTE